MSRSVQVDVRLKIREPLHPGLQFARGDLVGRGDARARRLREQADGVVAERRRIFVARPVVVVDRVRHDAPEAILGHVERDGAPEQSGLSPDDGIVIGVDRVGIGRRKEPRPVRSHLVHGQEDLRVPLHVEESGEVPALGQVHHERVAIDVVPCVRVVEAGHRASVERRATLAAVPVDDKPFAVRVERRDQNHDHVLQDGRRRRVVARRECVEQLARRLSGADFRGVDAAANGDDGLVRGDEIRGGVRRNRAGVGELLIDGANAIQVGDVRGRGDDGGSRAVALGRRTNVDDLDTVRP
jgi:hypothetical protein